ncbi:substrate-binding periplasmic protein [Vibrio atypicus]|uniref:substrate-binding periplasmic protein n=1 Tax=Vibrio atypicus TaxID=558271 RepID=UPI001CECE6DD|nr:transporter substrate-binding domain-containing protein [Vibrio atypicus]
MLLTRQCCLFCLFLFISTSAIAHSSEQEKLLHVCGDAIDWPPYTYTDGEEVKGIDLDILNQLLPSLGYQFNITMTSWTRCLKGTKEGDFDLAVSASYSEERAKHYLYTIWYYQITPYYLYSTDRFPEGLQIESVSDLEQYKVCGIHGYNYGDFQLDSVEQFTLSNFESITELKREQCDVFLSWQEILFGMFNIWGINFVQDDIVAKPIPNMPKHKFHMLVSKKFEQAEQLRTSLSQGLKQFQTSNN